MTYLHNIGVGFDDFCAAAFFNRNDLTVSAMCYIVRAGTDAQRAYLAASRVQSALLWWIGDGLERCFPGHCAAAFANDKVRAAAIVHL